VHWGLTEYLLAHSLNTRSFSLCCTKLRTDSPLLCTVLNWQLTAHSLLCAALNWTEPSWERDNNFYKHVTHLEVSSEFLGDLCHVVNWAASHSIQTAREAMRPPSPYPPLAEIYANRTLSFNLWCCLGLRLICCFVLPDYHAEDILKGKILCHHVPYSSKLIFYFCCLSLQSTVHML
jgi:hypothetical protein